MRYVLENNNLRAEIDSVGAELSSVICKGREYIWQRDEAYWTGSSPVLFPICGRLYGGCYTYRGKTYQMDKHGFARKSEFSVEPAGENKLKFSLHSNEKTKESYPFDFLLELVYTLEENRLTVSATVSNEGKEDLIFTYGAHPGFSVPFEEGKTFTDYTLEFEQDCRPRELIFTDTCFCTGKTRGYPLEDGNRLPLRHSLFDIDAIFFDRMGKSVTLSAKDSEHSVRLDFEGFPYLGIWHKPGTDAPYFCIEPWCGLPSSDGVTDDLESKSDMFRLSEQEKKTLSYQITFC